MSTTDLPPAILADRAAALERLPRAALMTAAKRMSDVYRGAGHSNAAVPSSEAALAYAIVRMPATYAALVRVLAEARTRAPDFVPLSLIDIGAGPGTATIAATVAWPSLVKRTLVEPNSHLAALAHRFLETLSALTMGAPPSPPPVGEGRVWGDSVQVRSSDHSTPSSTGIPPIPCPSPQGGGAERAVEMGGRRRPPAIVAAPLDTRLTLPPADLVIMSYVLVEQSADDAAKFLSHSAFASARMIILVEPGTPAGFARIRAARAKLIASGARIVAPCPHDRDCPLADSDWCHMSVRLSRTRDHKHVKGGSAPFEDEPFSYLAAVRGDLGAAASSRVIRAPSVSKTDATLRLCTVAGIVDRRIPRRDKAGYKAAKALKWGDPVPDPEA